MKLMGLGVLGLLAAAMGGLGGCASSRGGAGAEAAQAAPMPAGWPTDHRAQPAFDGRSGLPMTWDGVMAAASKADAVIIGEMHGHEMGLGVASALFEDIVARCPNTAALSMEFFERDQQMALNDYLTGVTTEEEFLKAAGRSEGNYPAGHRAMVEAARAAQRPVIAANAPRRYVRLARTEGFEKLASLTEVQREMFLIPESLTGGGYRDRFYALMGGMAMGHSASTSADGSPASEQGADAAPVPPSAEEIDAIVLPFYRSQNLWDATMADSVVTGLQEGQRPVVHVVGQFHCDFGGGLVERIRATHPKAKVLVVTMSGAWSDALRDEDRGKGDIVVYVGE